MPVPDDPRCPRCQGAVSLRELWKEAPKVRGVFLEGKVGIVCPSCGVKLRVLQYRVVLATLGLFAIFAAICAVFGDFERAHHIKPAEGVQILFIVSLVGGMFFLQWRYAYRFAAIRSLRDGEKASFPLSVSEVETPNLIDEAHLDMGLLSRVAAELHISPGNARPWICLKCKEENPGEFDSCWNCQPNFAKTLQSCDLC